MVQCVSLFGYFDQHMILQGIWDNKWTKLHKYFKKLVLWDNFEEIYGSGKWRRARHSMSNGYQLLALQNPMLN